MTVAPIFSSSLTLFRSWGHLQALYSSGERAARYAIMSGLIQHSPPAPAGIHGSQTCYDGGLGCSWIRILGLGDDPLRRSYDYHLKQPEMPISIGQTIHLLLRHLSS